MADAIVSVVAKRILGLLEEQGRSNINLVRGAEKEVLGMAEKLKTVRKVLDDAERRGIEDESIKDWLARLEETSYEIDDVLDEWDYEIRKLQIENNPPEDEVVAAASASKKKVWSCIPSSPCFCFKKVGVRHCVGKKILVVKAQLDDILTEKEKYSFVMSQPKTDLLPGPWRESNSSVELGNVYGRDSDRDNIVSKLMVSGDRNIVSVVGVGGLGKTTLAQLVYNDSRVKECFQLRIWVCVSNPFDVIGIATRIVEGVKKVSPPNTDQLEVALERLREAISGNKFLLVLDDVWNEESANWEPLRTNLKHGGGGSKILVTTRNKAVSRTMGTFEDDIHFPQGLSPEDCWLLLRRVSHLGRPEEDCGKFEEVGMDIARKCKGLPLAAAVLGGLLQSKDSVEEWENVLSSDIWQLEKIEDQLFSHLLLSYNELSPALKRCFSYCAVFPKDTQINVNELIEHWIAQGYLGNAGDMELKGQGYFNNLAMCSLFQDVKLPDTEYNLTSKTCKMHDIVHDFAQSLRKDRGSTGEEAKMPTCKRCSSLSFCSIKTYRSLLLEESNLVDICDFITRVRVLSAIGKRSLVISREIEHLIHLRRLDLSYNNISSEDFKTICKLYHLQFLRLQCCSLEGVPLEIGNIIKMRYLELSLNHNLKELPESICGLHELRILDIRYCDSLSRLPEGINRLINLKHLLNESCKISQYPQGLADLTNLTSLGEFMGGKGHGKFGVLKNLKKLSGRLHLIIFMSEDSHDMVEDVREADLRTKMHLRALKIEFRDKMDENSDKVRIDVLDALEPHPNLQHLTIEGYMRSKLEGWITSPHCQLRSIHLLLCNRMLSLPPLGRLPCLEEVYIAFMNGLKFVGREFLGVTGDDMGVQSSSNTIIGFPMLKKLTFELCLKWEVWEDITVEEEESASVSFMPCLEKLLIHGCGNLTVLPHRLLGKKALSLKHVQIYNSSNLIEHCENMGSAVVSPMPSRGFFKVQLRPN